VAVEAHKKNPADFVLWKLSSDDEPGWDSPWGRGRPGWHIECSAMSKRYLGEVFDIHGGGLDLIFPHHENEIAQSRCAHGTDVMAKVWIHNGFLQVEGQKMSKSLGNFVTINECLQQWAGDQMRFAMLSTHYTQPIDWTRSKLVEARSSLQKFHRWYTPKTSGHSMDFNPDGVNGDVLEALKDDLNTPEAFSALHRQTGELFDTEQQRSPEHNRRISEFSRSLDLLGIAPRPSQLSVDKDFVDNRITARLEARKAKNWAESDRIRDELAAMGIAIKDNKDGTTSWEVKR
jgi:cysteinyl-tRNA synthetase